MFCVFATRSRIVFVVLFIYICVHRLIFNPKTEKKQLSFSYFRLILGHFPLFFCLIVSSIPVNPKFFFSFSIVDVEVIFVFLCCVVFFCYSKIPIKREESSYVCWTNIVQPKTTFCIRCCCGEHINILLLVFTHTLPLNLFFSFCSPFFLYCILRITFGSHKTLLFSVSFSTI